MTQAAKMTQLAIAALEDKKAEDITLIDIAKVSVLADYFLIANGNNRNQVQAMADNVSSYMCLTVKTDCSMISSVSGETASRSTWMLFWKRSCSFPFIS